MVRNKDAENISRDLAKEKNISRPILERRPLFREHVAVFPKPFCGIQGFIGLEH